jgi:hypothetical protein
MYGAYMNIAVLADVWGLQNKNANLESMWQKTVGSMYKKKPR